MNERVISFKRDRKVLNRDEKRKKRRFILNFLIFLVALNALSFILMFIASFTKFWIICQLPKLSSSEYRDKKYVGFVRSRFGIWGHCDRYIISGKQSKHCSKYSKSSLFSDAAKLKLQREREEMEEEEAEEEEDLRDTLNPSFFAETTSVILTLILMALSELFAMWCLFEERFIFKRLCAIILFLSSIPLFALLQSVVVHKLKAADVLSLILRESSSKARHVTSYISFGFSFYLSIFCLFALIFSSLAFLVFSKKRKDEFALTESEALANRDSFIRSK